MQKITKQALKVPTYLGGGKVRLIFRTISVLRNYGGFHKHKQIALDLDSLSFRGILVWDTLQCEIKTVGTLAKFKKLMAKWDGKACHCSICK